MKLKRAPELNKNVADLAGTSRGAYYVVDTPFHVVFESNGGWFVWENHDSDQSAWLIRHGFDDLIGGIRNFPTRARAQALDALEMALEVDPL